MLLGLSRNIKKKKYIEAHCGCGLRENVGCTGCVTDMRQEINHNVKAMLNMWQEPHQTLVFWDASVISLVVVLVSECVCVPPEHFQHIFFFSDLYRECMYCKVRGVDTLLLLKCNMGIFLFLQAMGGIISPRWCNNYTWWLQNVMLIVRIWHVSLWITHHCSSNGNSARAYVFLFCFVFFFFFSVLCMSCPWPLDDRRWPLIIRSYFSWSGWVSAE